MIRFINVVFLSAMLSIVLVRSVAAQSNESDADTLNLARAERLALVNDPKVAAALARARAFAEQSVASGQLKDPQFRLGLFNLPIDDFDLKKNPTTQLRFGIMQQFPSGNTRELKTLRDQWLSDSENAMAEVDARTLLRQVREIWLDIWYQQSAQQVIRENRDLFKQLVNITEGQYASGRANQQDVFRADLELSRLDDRLLKARKAERGLRGRLTRWVGTDAQTPLPTTEPELPAPADLTALEAGLTEHPILKQKSALLEAQERTVQIAREQYKPAWSIGGEYRQRFGNDPDGSSRDSMIAMTATIDLPFFTAKRQDKQLAAAQQKADAVWFSRLDSLQTLRSEYYWRIADEEELQQRLTLYKDYLLRDARENAEASLQAYQAGTSEFTTLMRASITELDVQLQALRVQVDLLKNHASLQWLDSDQIQFSHQNNRQSGRDQAATDDGE